MTRDCLFQTDKNFVFSDVKNNAMRHIDFTPFRRIQFSGKLLVFDTFFCDKKYPIGARITNISAFYESVARFLNRLL